MLEIDLKTILQDGTFGPISIGSSMSEVVQLLGKPDDEGNFHSNNHILRYGWFEFIFKDEKLDLFLNKHILDHECNFLEEFHYKNSNFKVTTWFDDFDKDLKIKHVAGYLNQCAIRFKKIAFWESIKLITNSNVEIMFYNKQLDSRDVKSQNELSGDTELFKDEENWLFAGFYVLRNTLN